MSRKAEAQVRCQQPDPWLAGRSKTGGIVSEDMKMIKPEEDKNSLPPSAQSTPAGQAQLPSSQHLASCPVGSSSCEVDADMALLRATPPPEPGPYFATRVMAEIGLAQKGQRRGWFAWGRALGSAAAGLLVVAGLGAGALIGRSLAHSHDTESTSLTELTVSADEPAFADVFESALAGE